MSWHKNNRNGLQYSQKQSGDGWHKRPYDTLWQNAPQIFGVVSWEPSQKKSMALIDAGFKALSKNILNPKLTEV